MLWYKVWLKNGMELLVKSDHKDSREELIGDRLVITKAYQVYSIPTRSGDIVKQHTQIDEIDVGWIAVNEISILLQVNEKKGKELDNREDNPQIEVPKIVR